MCKKLRLIKTCAFYNFRLWRGNARIVTVFVLALILCFLLTDQVIGLVKEQGTTIQIAESFIWTFGDSSSILLSSLLLLLLFADMPFVTNATPLFLVRCSRKIWVLGQLLYIGLATGIYLLFILISTCALCAPYSFVKNIWSKTASILAYSAEYEGVLPVSLRAMEMTSPFECVGDVFLLLLLYTLSMVFLMMFFHLWKGQLAGIVSVLVYSAFGILLNPDYMQAILDLPDELFYQIRVAFGWISPLNHATYSMHSFGYDNLPRLWQSSVIFLGIIAVLVVLTMRIMRKFSFQFKGTDR